jgi:hypothetical protein
MDFFGNGDGGREGREDDARDQRPLARDERLR